MMMKTNWLRNTTLAVFRVQRGDIVFSEIYSDDFDLDSNFERRVLRLASLPPVPRILFAEAEIGDGVRAVTRYLRTGACVALCHAESLDFVRDRLIEVSENELYELGGGLSNCEDWDSLFAEDLEVDSEPDVLCSSASVATFLNDAFEFIFSRASAALRVAYCRSFASRFDFLAHRGTSIEASDPDCVLERIDCERLTQKFDRMVDALDMSEFARLENSPISSPPWEKAYSQPALHEVAK